MPIPNTYPGKFIVFEGLDGSGETTQAGLLKEFLEKNGIEVLPTKEPTDYLPIGSLIRTILQEKEITSPHALQLLFTANRGDHLDRIIIPALKKGIWVISDRYFYSTFAYGSIDLPMDWLININDLYLQPDKVFLMRVSPEVCIERIHRRGVGIQLFEKKAKLEKAWSGYEKVAERFREIAIINGERPIEDIAQDIRKEAKNFL